MQITEHRIRVPVAVLCSTVLRAVLELALDNASLGVAL